MTIREASMVAVAPEVHSLELLKEAAEVYRSLKCWGASYFIIREELHRRATRQWVKEDVFGHTFTGNQ